MRVKTKIPIAKIVWAPPRDLIRHWRRLGRVGVGKCWGATL